MKYATKESMTYGLCLFYIFNAIAAPVMFVDVFAKGGKQLFSITEFCGAVLALSATIILKKYKNKIINIFPILSILVGMGNIIVILATLPMIYKIWIDTTITVFFLGFTTSVQEVIVARKFKSVMEKYIVEKTVMNNCSKLLALSGGILVTTCISLTLYQVLWIEALADISWTSLAIWSWIQLRRIESGALRHTPFIF